MKFLTVVYLSVAALMDAEPRILGRQLRGAFRRIAKRSNEAALEGELINCEIFRWLVRFYNFPIKKPHFTIVGNLSLRREYMLIYDLSP